MRRPRSHHLLPLIALLIAACGGKSCSCLGPIPGGFPTDSRRHENALQVRVTGSAFDYLAANGQQLLSALLPMGTKFNIPASCTGSDKVCCGNPQPTCTLDINNPVISLVPNPPSTIAFTVTTALQSEGPIPINYSLFGIGVANCLVTIDTAASTTAHKTIDIVSDIDFSVDSTTDLTSITLDNTKINNLDGSMITISSQPSDILNLCGGVNWGPIKSFLVGVITSTITGQISGAVNSAFCASCTTQMDCDSFADSCTSGQCMRKGACLQEIGATGRLDVASLSSLFASTQAKLDILAVLGGYAEVPSPQGMGMGNTSGLSLGLLGGSEAAAHNPCVPMRSAPSVPMVPKWSQELASTEPENGKPYHVAFGVHESYLNTLAFAAFDSGTLCLDVGTATIEQIDSQVLGILIPSLSDLTHRGDAPVYLAVRPNQEPNITLGAGTFKTDMNGNRVIDDPLLHVAIPQLSIDFYVFVDQRYIRVMTLTADVNLPVALDLNAMGQIVPIIGNISDAFTNLTVTNSDLLSETPQHLASMFPALLAVAGNTLGKLSPISLPAVAGLNLQIVAIEPTDNKTILSIFANIGLGAMMDGFHAATDAQLTSVVTPPTSAFQTPGALNPALQPSVNVLLDGIGHAGDSRDLEWQVNLDDGLWSPFSSQRELSFSDPRLWLQGRHQLAVRARVVGEPSTVNANAAYVDFIVDSIAPVGSFDVESGAVVMSATDMVTPPEKLRYSVMDATGTYTPWSTNTSVHLSIDPSNVMAKVIDEAGNVGMLEFHGQMTTPAASGCGCAVGGRAPEQAPIGGIAPCMGLLLFALLQRNKLMLQRNKMLQSNTTSLHRNMAPLAALALLSASGALSSACDSSMPMATPIPNSSLEDSLDEIGRYSSSVAASGTIYVSGYDDTQGDLAYTEIDETKLGSAVVWQWVDGVPDVTPPIDPTMYRNGSTDPGDDVGLYTSIALGSDGNARIAYYDYTNGALKFAVSVQRVFHYTVVDQPAMGQGQSGLYSSLSLDGNNVPSIAYMQAGIPDGKGGYESKLRVATAVNADPSGPSDWSILDVDTTAVPCANLCVAPLVCVPTDPKDATKSTCESVDAAPCNPGCSDTQACISKACVTIQTPLKAPEFPEGIGLFSTLLRQTSGLRTIVYYDRTHGSIKLAQESTPALFVVSYIDGNDPTMDLGQFANAAYGPDGTLHTAYVDAINNRLLYKAIKGGVVPMTAEVVDSGMRSNGPEPVGAGASIIADATTVRVAYQDQSVSDLWLARRDSGTWTTAALQSGPQGFGFYPHIVDDAGKNFVTQFIYDRAAQAAMMSLGSLTVAAVP